MSPEEQRIAIAEFCKLPPEVTWKLPSSFVVDNENRFLLPDFTNDLNACAAMEKTLTKDQIPMYFRNLVPSDKEWLDNSCWEVLCFATASQRCEAFLKTLNLWKE